MKILYILGDYGLNMSANGVCSSNIIKELLKNGHTVTLLVNDGNKTLSITEEKEFTVARVKPRFALRLFKKSNDLIKKQPKKSRFIATLAKIVNKLQLFITAPWWPLISQPTIRRLTKAAIALHKKNNFDAVISVYTPLDTLLAGYNLKKQFPDIKFFPYFLDSLSGGYGPRYFSKEKIIQNGLKFEKKIFPFAKKIIVMKSSRKHHEKYNQEFLDNMAFLDIPSFLDVNITPTSARKPDDSIKLLYTGSIPYAVRDPRGLINFLMNIDENNVICEFAGTIDCLHLFEPLRKKMGENLIFCGQITHSEAIQKMQEADIFINIGNKIPTMIPSKIFEYISYGKPIISTYDIDDEPCIPYLENYPLATLIDCRKSIDQKFQISSILEKSKNVNFNTDKLSELYKLNTPAAFAGLITED